MSDIKLVNINLEGITKNQQLKKIYEEDEEFKQALDAKDYDNMIEEFWDCVQARLGLLNIYSINAFEVMEGYSKHLEKIKNRPRIKKIEEYSKDDFDDKEY